MVFSAPTFVFLFLPVVLALVLISPKALRNTVLLAASLFFYAWGESEFVAVMIASICFNYFAGLWIGRPAEGGSGKGSPVALALAIAGNLALLGWFKYAGFVATNLAPLIQWSGLGTAPFSVPAAEAIHLPIGISFFTFQAISYLIDTYRGEHPPQRNPIRLALFISLFPQLIAGPIVRYKDLVGQLAERTIDTAGAAEGVRRFTIGLSKKLLIANSLAIPADAIFDLPTDELSPSVAWFGLLCYSLQIYFDFSGYSDMAIGLGRFFGFRLPENFNDPYRATTLTDFWRRWHISLSRWFRDYLYIPLGGNRRGARRTYLNLFVVFLLCGLWHGASWNFVIWGLIHGGFLIVERVGLESVLSRAPRPVAHAYCLLVVALAWVFFRADTLPHAVAYCGGLVGLGATAAVPILIIDFVSIETLVVCTIALVWASGGLRTGWQRLASGRLPDGALLNRAAFRIWAPTSGLATLWLLCGMKLASRTYDPFLYFRF